MQTNPKALVAAALLATVGMAQAGTAYVSSEKDDALTLIDTATLAVKGTIKSCKRTRHIQRMPDGKLMVACTDSNAADIIDPASAPSPRTGPGRRRRPRWRGPISSLRARRAPLPWRA